MQKELGFSAGVQRLKTPEKNLLGVLTPNPVKKDITGEAELRRTLQNPIGTASLKEIVKPGKKIATTTSGITLVFALGSHRKHTPEKQKKLAGEHAFNEITCIDGDANDCVHIAVTQRGTPVDIVRCVAEADRRICLGNIEYHCFAGCSGGTKAIML